MRSIVLLCLAIFLLFSGCSQVKTVIGSGFPQEPGYYVDFCKGGGWENISQVYVKNPRNREICDYRGEDNPEFRSALLKLNSGKIRIGRRYTTTEKQQLQAVLFLTDLEAEPRCWISKGYGDNPNVKELSHQCGSCPSPEPVADKSNYDDGNGYSAFEFDLSGYPCTDIYQIQYNGEVYLMVSK